MIFRQTIRSLTKQKGLVLVSTATLAIGIGATTSIFSIAESVLLRPLPYDEPDRVVIVWETEPSRAEGRVSGANFLDWQEQNTVFEALGAFFPTVLTRSDTARAELLSGVEVSPGFFQVFGVTPRLGRTFSPDPEDAKSVVLSYEYWANELGADPSVLGRALTLDEETYSVIGVAPRGFRIPFEQPEVWIRAPKSLPRPPIDLGLDIETVRGLHWLRVFARLRPGMTLEQAQAEMELVAQRLAEAYPEENAGRGARVVPLADQVRAPVRPALYAFFGAVGLLLLVACANVANLLLARATSREREIAVRSALGASRSRLVTEFLVESATLALLGGVLGLLLALASNAFVVRFGPSDVFRLEEVQLNPVVLSFAILASLATGLLFGILPALSTSKLDPSRAIQDDGRASEGRGRRRLRATLVVAEVGFALVLLVGAGLLLRSFVELRAVDAGFDPESVLTMRVWFPEARYDEEGEIVATYEQILERLSSLPGIESASAVLGVPLSGTSANFGIVLEGRPPPPPGGELEAGFQSVAAGYFRTMGIPLLRGRDVSPSDDADATPVAVVNRTAAERFWPGEDPLGKRLSSDGEEWLEVVGVVGDVLHNGLELDPRAEVYAPYRQAVFPFMSLVLRVSGSTDGIIEMARNEIQEVDRQLPVHKVMTMDEVVSASISQPRFHSFVIVAFAAAATLLAGVGLYGLIAFGVGQRRREIGIRMALGAKASDVVGSVVREGVLLSAAGLGIGLIGATTFSRFLGSFLFRITTTDVATYGAVSALLLLVGTLASIIPARRGARIDPLSAIRHE